MIDVSKLPIPNLEYQYWRWGWTFCKARMHLPGQEWVAESSDDGARLHAATEAELIKLVRASAEVTP